MNIPKARQNAAIGNCKKPHVRRSPLSKDFIFVWMPNLDSLRAKSCAEVNDIIAKHGAEQK